MNKLKQVNLYQSELIQISGKLVERYNECLYTLGFTKTKLENFSIDGIGWSPEIAEEKGDTQYLNHGEANSHGIIISPLQNGKAVYMPFHTFDRDMMKHVFKTYQKKINSITRDSAICLDFDQDIDAFYEPLDLLRYDEISIHFKLINNLIEKQEQQQQLINKFKKDNNFINEGIHEQLLESAKKYGDLRNRDLTLPTLQFKVSSFYTRAFKGVYLLRDFISRIIIFEDLKWYKEAIKDTTHDVLIYHIDQPELMEKLRDHVIIEYDLEKVVKTKRYDRIKKYELALCLKNPQHPIIEILDNNALFKSYLNKIDIKDRKRIMSVERYLEKLEISNQYKLKDIVDPKMFDALQQPHSSLETKHQDLIWKLIVNVSPKDVLFLYWYDKEEFYKNYTDWQPTLQDWVIERISDNI